MRRVLAMLLAALMSAGVACAQAPAGSNAKAASVPDTIAQRVTACSICHGKSGEGILKNEYYPRLAGKPAELSVSKRQQSDALTASQNEKGAAR